MCFIAVRRCGSRQNLLIEPVSRQTDNDGWCVVGSHPGISCHTSLRILAGCWEFPAYSSGDGGKLRDKVKFLTKAAAGKRERLLLTQEKRGFIAGPKIFALRESRVPRKRIISGPDTTNDQGMALAAFFTEHGQSLGRKKSVAEGRKGKVGSSVYHFRAAMAGVFSQRIIRDTQHFCDHLRPPESKRRSHQGPGGC